MYDVGFWSGKASDYLAAFRRAADLGGYGPSRVAEWVHGDASEAEQILRNHGEHEAADLLAELHGDANADFRGGESSPG
jgi:hypothetical protein